MDGRGGGGGGCIARYTSGSVGGGGGGCYGEIAYGMSKVDRIMLKFRPIAPKPVATGSGSSCSTLEHSDGSGGTRRRKRRYVRVNANKKKNTNTVSKKRKVSTSSCETSGPVVRDTVVTLALMPETPDRKENSSSRTTSSPSDHNKDLLSFAKIIDKKKPTPLLLSFNKNQFTACDGDVIVASPITSPSVLPLQKAVATSFMTVESVTNTWMNGEGLGFTDQAKVMSMEMDTCPSFITNSRDTVVWTNKAYKQMISGRGPDESTVVVTKKFNRVTMPVSHPGFTCTVKVTWGTEQGASPLTVTAPCDVWRLRNGGYAWRLDVTAALSLGR